MIVQYLEVGLSDPYLLTFHDIFSFHHDLIQHLFVNPHM